MTPCSQSKLVDRHFAGTITPEQERTMRTHLPECAGCQHRYERRLLLARLDPRALGAEDRMARGLGVAPPPRRPFGWVFLSTASFATAALLVLFFVVPHAPGEFRARGGPGATSALLVYRLQGDHTPALVTTEIGASDELAFAYRNPGGKRHLAVFGVDEHGHVYWFHPAWTEAKEDPVAIAIEPGPGTHELPAAISQPFDGAVLHLYAAFTNEPLHVRQIEATLDAAHPERTPSLPGAALESMTLQVKR
jgi:hypothetical protein